MLIPTARLYLQILAFGSFNVQVFAYDLVKTFQGLSFFDDWDFYGSWDNLTLGDVWWVNRDDAFSQHLAYVNEAGNAILKVDDATDVPFNIKRNSVRITTRDSFNFGSLWIVDLVHMPFGCSVWPAFWTLGPDWPNGGEIDIIEGINLNPVNQVALHTTSGCVLHAPPWPFGTQLQADCSVASGCCVQDTRLESYGQKFAENGGGVWAAQFDVAGIYVWFWPRSQVPSTIQNEPLDVSHWGAAHAAFPNQSSCPITQFFGPQQLVFDITLCGEWAGLPVLYDPVCGSSGSGGNCYLNNVIGSGDDYADAYFEISYVKAYTTAAPGPSGSSTFQAAKGQSNDANTFSPYTHIWDCFIIILLCTVI